MRSASVGAELRDLKHRRAADAAVERVASPSCRRVLGQFVEWLAIERRLGGGSIELVIRVVVMLLADLVGAGTCVARIRRVSPVKVERFIKRHEKRRSSLGGMKLRWGVALFLRFCVARGWRDPAFLDGQRCLRAQTPWTPEAPRRHAEVAIARLQSASVRRVLRDYTAWLVGSRELALSSVEHHVRVSRIALAAWAKTDRGCVGRLRTLRMEDVEGFLESKTPELGACARRHLHESLRLFLRFGVERGWVTPTLPAAVPSVRRYRLSTVPRGVPESDMPALVAELRSFSSRRELAIFLLLVTYGIRRAQVANLRLKDLDWERRGITFPAHKGGRVVQHTMTPAVADALARYLRERGDSKFDHVFLLELPFPRPMSPGSITSFVRRLFVRAGMRPRGPHAFRHAFAQRVLGARRTFKVVADLLGHRSLESTAIYAKVDVQRLSEVPLEWPEALR
jgi:integrase